MSSRASVFGDEFRHQSTSKETAVGSLASKSARATVPPHTRINKQDEEFASDHRWLDEANVPRGQ